MTLPHRPIRHDERQLPVRSCCPFVIPRGNVNGVAVTSSLGINPFCHVMEFENRHRGFFVAVGYSSDAIQKCSAFYETG